MSSISNTMGTLLVGVIVCAVLWGVALLQTYNYYNLYRADHLPLKSLVAIVFATDTVHHITESAVKLCR
ncbi:hypothetical protein C8Q80DRAFT_620725 [Daedaleopsis nitida]|nr:hypothetical protein C8Q80DRAFT_620725 [Daedaleopsis nitida]